MNSPAKPKVTGLLGLSGEDQCMQLEKKQRMDKARLTRRVSENNQMLKHRINNIVINEGKVSGIANAEKKNKNIA